jgi:hypothetical protein
VTGGAVGDADLRTRMEALARKWDQRADLHGRSMVAEFYAKRADEVRRVLDADMREDAPAFGRDHDRRIIENAQLPVVLVECPHVIGLCYDNAESGMIVDLPCPCNEPSRIVARLTLADVENTA